MELVETSRNALSRRPEADTAALGDWQELCRIIMARVTLTGNEWLAATPAPDVEYTARRVEASIRECSAALQQLRRTLVDEVGRRRSLEQQVLEARTALSQPRAAITHAQDEDERAGFLAMHDCLTLLPNRDFFLERLEFALTEMEPPRQALAVLYLELDYYTPSNDAAVGDELLRVVAERLERGMRPENIVCRLDGDEFACLVPGLPSREQVRVQASELFDIVSVPVTIGALQIRPHPNIGIAMCPEDGYTADALLANAANAMDWAKRQNIRFAFSRVVPTLY
jgi:diguanylate cyclase (GGDEF)-like protein